MTVAVKARDCRSDRTECRMSCQRACNHRPRDGAPGGGRFSGPAGRFPRAGERARPARRDWRGPRLRRLPGSAPPPTRSRRDSVEMLVQFFDNFRFALRLQTKPSEPLDQFRRCHTDIAPPPCCRTRGDGLRLDPGDAVDRWGEHLPAAALDGKHFTALRRQPIKPASPLARAFCPAAFNPATLFEAVEQGIERRDRELQRAAGTLLDELADVVAVPGRSSTSARISSSALPFLSSRAGSQPRICRYVTHVDTT